MFRNVLLALCLIVAMVAQSGAVTPEQRLLLLSGGKIVSTIITSGTTWTVPAGVTSLINVEAIAGAGAGGRGQNSVSYGSGGCAGAYSATTYFPVVPGATLTIQIGQGGASPATANTAGGAGTDTWISNTGSAPTTLLQGVLAKGGAGGTVGLPATPCSTSSQIAAGIGVLKTAGGAGGPSATNGAMGGGGAGGPKGNGAVGGIGQTSGGNSCGGGGGAGGGTVGSNGGAGISGGVGGNNYLGVGGRTGQGTTGTTPTAGALGASGGGGQGGGGATGSNSGGAGGAGGNGAEWGFYGAGGGGGCPGSNASGTPTPGLPGAGGLFGGAGGGNASSGSSNGPSGTGGQGAIRITYRSPVGVAASAVPSPPSAAVAAGLTNLVFFDGFDNPGTIDFNNTKAPGYNWYLNNAWPNSGISSGVPGYPPTPPGYVVVSNSILTLRSDPLLTGGFGFALNTAGFKSSAPGYVGTAFGNTTPFYAAARIKYDPTQAILADNSWPAFWTLGLDILTGAVSGYSEFDFFEGEPTGAGVAPISQNFHWWTVSGGVQTHNYGNGLSRSGDGNFHVYEFLYMPAIGAAAGKAEFRIDGAIVDPVNYQINFSTSTTPTRGDGSAYPGAPPTGAFAPNELFPLIIGTGPNWSVQVDWVAVWQ